MRLQSVLCLGLIALGSAAMAQERPAPGPVATEASQVELQRALDRTVELNVTDATIDEVFQHLARQTGVRFAIEPDTYEYLPYGRQTRLAVVLRNITLRRALTDMLNQQALSWEPVGGQVAIRPSDALYRIGRRASYDELRILGRLGAARLEPVEAAGTPLEQLRRITDNPDLTVYFQVDPGQVADAQARARQVLPAAAMNWLDALTSPSNWTWYLRGDEIVVLPKRQQIQRQLQRQVSLAYRNAELTGVLFDLARQARAPLSFEPGVLNLLPEQTRENFNLMMSDASIVQALTVIGGATGLDFAVTDEGIHVSASPSLDPGAPRAQADRARFLIRMGVALPNGAEVDVFFRPDDLPPDLLEYIEREKTRLMEQWSTPQPR